MLPNPIADKAIWRHQIYKHQNVTRALVITIVFGIRYNFSFFYLLNYKFVDLIFYFSQGKICAPKKSCTSQRFCSPEPTQSGLIKWQVCMCVSHQRGVRFRSYWWNCFNNLLTWNHLKETRHIHSSKYIGKWFLFVWVVDIFWN